MNQESRIESGRISKRRWRGAGLAAAFLAGPALALLADAPSGHLITGTHTVQPLWDLFLQSGEYDLRGSGNRSRHAAVSPDGNRIYVVREDNQGFRIVTALHANDGTEAWNTPGIGAVREIGAGANGVVTALAFLFTDLFVVGFDEASGSELWRETISVSSGGTRPEPIALAVHQGTGRVAVVWQEPAFSVPDKIAVLDTGTGTSIWTGELPFGFRDRIGDLEFSPDGQQLFLLMPTAADSFTAMTTLAFDAGTGTRQWDWTHVQGYVTTSSDSSLVFVPKAHTQMRELAVSPDGASVVAVGYTQTICFPESSNVNSIAAGEFTFAVFALDAANGDQKWMRTPPAPGGLSTRDPCVAGADLASSVAITPGGQVIVAGTSEVADWTVSKLHEAYTVAFGLADGATLWENRDGQIRQTHEIWLNLTPDGGTAVIAAVRQLQPISTCSFGDYPTAVALDTTDGTPIWRDVWVRFCEQGFLFGQGRFTDGVLSPDGGVFYGVIALGFQVATTAVAFEGAGTDTTPPAIVGQNQTFEATRPDGGAVSYELPTAIDETDGEVPVTCSPKPGTFFWLGETTITCMATDSAGNASEATFTITVDPKPPVTTLDGELFVRCLHSPIFPAVGEPVTIRAEALTAAVTDPATTPIVADEIEIWAIDQSGPKLTVQNTHDLSYGTTAVGLPSMMPYACRVRVGDTVTFSGWRQTSVFGRDGAIPIIYTGDRAERLDILFIADSDSYSDPLDPVFLDDVHKMIRNGYYDYPMFAGLGGQDRFNFWIATDLGATDGIVSRQCTFEKPARWQRKYGFVDATAVVHTDAFRDCAQYGHFTTEPWSFATLLHETGHRPFGLADEYANDGGYYQLRTNPNLYRNLRACESDAADLGRALSACRGFTDVRGEDWFLSEPDQDDLMSDYKQPDTGRPRAADIRRILSIYFKCSLGEC